MYKSVNGIVPLYICGMAITCEASRSLRSAQQCLLFIPKAKCVTLGERAFSVTGPRKWNKLPLGTRQADTVAIFNVKLKNLPLFLALLSRVLLYCLVRLDFIDCIVRVLLFYL